MQVCTKNSCLCVHVQVFVLIYSIVFYFCCFAMAREKLCYSIDQLRFAELTFTSVYLLAFSSIITDKMQSDVAKLLI